MSAIEIRGLVAGYPGQKPVLEDLNLAVSPGEMVALCGANGSGKSTLLKVLSGHLHPLAGSVEVLGVSPLACRGRVAYLPQKTTFDPGFPISVREMVTLGLVARLGSAGGLHSTAKAKILEAMQQLEISEIADKPLSRLSGGQLQRAVLARCLAQSPEVMLLDEPLSAADGRAREIAWEVLTEKARQGVTLLIATHTELDLKFCHRCLTFSEGSALETNQTISTTFHGVSP